MIKQELRKVFLSRMRQQNEEILIQKSQQIFHQLMALPQLQKSQTLSCFLSIQKNKEIRTDLLIPSLEKNFPSLKICVPRSDFSNFQMTHHIFKTGDELIFRGPGIPEPQGGEEVNPLTIDLILLPMICFDKSGYRVGYGKGFYDRFLEKTRPDALRVGLCLFEAVEKIDDTDPYDQLMDLCITPETIYKFNRNA